MNPSQRVAGVEPSLSEHPIIDKALSHFADEVIATLTSRVAELEEERDAYEKGCESAKRDANHWHSEWTLNQTEKINLRGERAQLTADLSRSHEWRVLLQKEKDQLTADLSTARAEVEALRHPRIFTRCPECRNNTLTLNKGRLLCTWHDCPDPCAIDNAEHHFAVFRAELQSAKEALTKAAEYWATREIDSEHEIVVVQYGPAQAIDAALAGQDSK